VSYPYTKDVIMSPAGAFHALAAGAAIAALLERVCVRPARRLVLSIALCALCATWSIRLVAINYALREHAWIVRNDWTEVFGVNAPIDFTSDSRAVALARTLQQDAIVRRVPASYFAQPQANRVLEIPW
jgi:branched-subunit amino acid ABC-type transport system permease component